VNSNGPRPPDDTSVRVNTRLVLLLSVLAGIGAAILTRLAGQPWPVAVLAAGGGVTAAFGFFDRILS
jgi:hypothetical protein